MAGEKSLFAPVPLRAMTADLSGLQLRVLICVAAHDRMSLAKGKGQGCRASNARMTSMVGCSYGKLCTSLSQLVTAGMLQREPLGRHTVYRVIYSDADKCLFGNTTPRATCDQTDIPDDATCDRQFPETPGNAPENPSQYIPLNGGIDLEESREINSDNLHILDSSEIDPRERGLPTISLRQHLPARFNDLASHAQVPAIERAFKAMGGDPDRIPSTERTEIASLLDAIAEAFPDEPTGQQAARLFGEIAQF